MKKIVTLKEILEYIKLDSSDVPDCNISGINTLKDASENELSFFDNPKYINDLKSTKAKAVLLKNEFIDSVPNGTIAITSQEPYLLLAYATKLFAPKLVETDGNNPKIGQDCTIMDNVYLGKNTIIGDNCVIMSGAFIGDNVSIGNDCVIYPNVTVYRDCKIGLGCIVHANSVIGSDGFGFAHTKDGKHIKIYQNGNVVIGNDVEIGSNTSIDRAVFGTTKICDGVKIDNLVQIGHNCIIGEYSIIVSHVGISGSTILGRNVVMGGQSATSGHLEIAPFTTIAARGGVTKSIKDGGKIWAGFPLMEHKTWLKLQAKISNLLK
nr:UDP-3-O-(3-hydroxymyristoyl)glucosamine N-acyltransferase [Arcobacter sp. FWKO B]